MSFDWLRSNGVSIKEPKCIIIITRCLLLAIGTLKYITVRIALGMFIYHYYATSHAKTLHRGLQINYLSACYQFSYSLKVVFNLKESELIH